MTDTKPIPNITNIDRTQEQNSDTGNYVTTIKIWFATGGAISFTDDGNIITRTTYLPNDPYSAWDGCTISKSNESNVDEAATVFLSDLTERDTLSDLDGVFTNDVIKTLKN